MKKFILALLLVVGLASLAFAAVVVQEDGVKVNVSDKINFIGGPDVSGNGTVTDIDFSTVSGPVTFDDALYAFGNTNAANTGIFVKQVDGGCSRCGVDNAGTTWSCVNITCP